MVTELTLKLPNIGHHGRAGSARLLDLATNKVTWQIISRCGPPGATQCGKPAAYGVSDLFQLTRRLAFTGLGLSESQVETMFV